MLKKRFYILTLLIATFLFCVFVGGCTTKYSYFDYDELTTRVKKVEILNISSNGYEETLKVLSEEEMDEFFQDLSKIRYTHMWGDPYGLTGVSVKLRYKNGETETFNWAWGMKASDKVIFNRMIEKYLDPYQTTDISQYRTLPDMKDYERCIANCSDAVMPKEMEEFFTVEKYSLTFYDWNGAHEEYLEIRIEDETQYRQYINDIIGDKETEEFFYDTKYREYAISDYVDSAAWIFNDGETVKVMSKAKIQKILFSDEENTVIFISILVLEESYRALQDELYYFERFNIEAADYHNGEQLIGGYER